MPHGPLPPNACLAGHEIDHRVAGRLRRRRRAFGILPQALDAALGLPEGSIGAYEAGEMPIPAAILLRLAMLLKVEIDALFAADPRDENLSAIEPEPPATPETPTASEIRSLMEAWAKVTHAPLRSDFVAVVQSLADGSRQRQETIDPNSRNHDD
jgi:transcriptional regulator with XRE-family HTH domain